MGTNNPDGQIYGQATDYLSNGAETALKVRIDTEELIDKIEEFLLGGKTLYGTGKDGQMITSFIKKGEPQLNNIGCQAMTAFCAQLINPQTVQGNMDGKQLNRYLMDLQQHLAYVLMINRTKWNIDNCNRNHILGSIMMMIEPYISRTKDNKERESYDNTIKMVESRTVIDNSQQGGGMNIFGGRRN